MKKKISTPNAPAAIGPYSQTVLVNDTLYISGQIPLDPVTGEIAGDTIEAQAEQVFKNLSAILTEAGMTFDDVVKATVLLDNIADFAAVNAIYGKYLCGEILPARAAFAVDALPKGVKVEIEMIAVK
ncbi:MAG: RidA family protein [Oscillospiraceae bacterium]|nr:RidA family protein [Oscillospiraceae bacterium]